MYIPPPLEIMKR